jgi:ACS family hexuronate transporter-like MFS transporter
LWSIDFFGRDRILNGAVTLGAVVSPIVIPLINEKCGWKGTFIATGALGIFPLTGWLGLYERPDVQARLTSEERELIREGAAVPNVGKVSWIRLLRYRQLWAIAVSKMLTDPVFYLCLYWLPKILAQEHNIRGTAIMPYLSTVWALTGVGSVAAGYVSSTLIERGWSVNRARKTVLGTCAGVMPIIIVAGQIRHLWMAVLLIGTALAAHQGFSANIFTLAPDMFPSRSVASVVGIAGFLGGVGTVVASELTGRVLERDPNFYLPMFIGAGTVYVGALVLIHLLSPRLEPVQVR